MCDQSLIEKIIVQRNIITEKLEMADTTTVAAALIAIDGCIDIIRQHGTEDVANKPTSPTENIKEHLYDEDNTRYIGGAEFKREIKISRIYKRCPKCHDGCMNIQSIEQGRIHGRWEPCNNHGHHVGYTHKCDKCGFRRHYDKQYPLEERIEL